MARTHAVTAQQHHDRVGTGIRHQATDGGIESDVDVLHRVAKCTQLVVAPRIGRVMHVPELMAGAVRVTEDRQEEVPPALFEEVAGQLGLTIDTREEVIA